MKQKSGLKAFSEKRDVTTNIDYMSNNCKIDQFSQGLDQVHEIENGMSPLCQLFYVDGVYDNSPKVLGREDFWRFVRSSIQKNLIIKYRSELVAGRDGDRYKEQLVAYMPQGIYIPHQYHLYLQQYEAERSVWSEAEQARKLSPRNDMLTEPSGRCVLDFDNVPDPQALFQHFKEVLAEEGLLFEQQVAFAWISASGQGLKIDMRRQKGKTIDEEFSKWETLLGVPVDHKCKNLSRIHFLPHADDILYINEEMLFSNSPINPADYPNSIIKLKNNKMTKKTQSPSVSVKTQLPTQYEGIPLTHLFQMVEHLNGGPAHKGERYIRIFDIACDLRHAAGYNFDVLKRLIPAYDGISDEEHSKAILGALKYTDAEVSVNLSKAVEICEMAKLAEEDETKQQRQAQPAPCQAPQSQTEEDFESETQAQFRIDYPRMPERLPQCVEDFLSNLPEKLRDSLVLTIFPALTTHFHNVTFHFTDNRDYHPALIVLLVGFSAGGKSSVTPLCNAILNNIIAKDKVNREREEEWKQKYRTTKASQAKPAKPQGLVVQCISSNCTQAALIERLHGANGRSLYISVPEIEYLKRITEGNLESLHTMPRIAYDHDLWGSERKGIDNSSYSLPLALNINASCTVGSLRRFIGHSITDGTFSRFLLPFILDDPNDWDPTIPKYGVYDEAYMQKIQPYIELITHARGSINSDDACRWAQEEMNRKMDIAYQNDNPRIKTFLRRTVHTAFRIGMTIYVMNNYQWTREIEDFMSWVVDYDLWSKNYHLGDLIHLMLEKEIIVPHLENKDVLNYLPESFTLEQAEDMKKKMKIVGGSLREMLRKRVQRGALTYDPQTKFYTVVDKNKSKKSKK